MKKTFKLILIILWMILIFFLSNENATKSGNTSDNFTINVINTFRTSKISKKEGKIIARKYITPIRKSAHFCIYLILGLLIYGYLKEFNLSLKDLIIYTIFISFCYALSDEVHQLYVVGRSGELRDVLIDTLGSTSGIIFVLFFKKIIKSYR